MKKLLKMFTLMAIILCYLVFAFGCGMEKSDYFGGGGYGYKGDAAFYPSLERDVAAGIIVDDGVYDGEIVVDDGVEPESPQNNYQAGLITAAAWDDNTYYDYWKSLFLRGQTEEENGKFLRYAYDPSTAGTKDDNTWGFDSTKRVTVNVTTGEEENAVCGAVVKCLNSDGKVVFTAKTNAAGRAYLFPSFYEGTVSVAVGDEVEVAAFTQEERDISISFGSGNTKLNVIKIMFVIDVTGSMGDELEYLKVELEDIINRIASFDEQTEIDLAFLFYRDHGDQEVFRYDDFLNVTIDKNLQIHLNNLRSQRASGGGDYEEAVEEALDMAVNKYWGDDNSTKLIFHILDAPPHDTAAIRRMYKDSVYTAAEKGIRMCPVLCSGVSLLCEYLTRQEAILTGGTFVYLTDHSGIGLSHYDPEMPEITVETLNNLIVRLVRGYHTGTFEEPVPWAQVVEGQEQ